MTPFPSSPAPQVDDLSVLEAKAETKVAAVLGSVAGVAAAAGAASSGSKPWRRKALRTMLLVVTFLKLAEKHSKRALTVAEKARRVRAGDGRRAAVARTHPCDCPRRIPRPPPLRHHPCLISPPALPSLYIAAPAPDAEPEARRGAHVAVQGREAVRVLGQAGAGFQHGRPVRGGGGRRWPVGSPWLGAAAARVAIRGRVQQGWGSGGVIGGETPPIDAMRSLRQAASDQRDRVMTA